MDFRPNPKPDRRDNTDVTTVSQIEQGSITQGTADGRLRYAGLPVFWRRVVVVTLNVVTLIVLGSLVFSVLLPGGIDFPEMIMLAGFLFATPWTVLGFWNAVIGMALLHGFGNPSRSIYPFYREQQNAAPRSLSSRTALTVFLRNEDPAPIFRRLEAIWTSLELTGLEQHFRLFVLSDTSAPEIAAAEEAVFAQFAQSLGLGDDVCPIYRRRAVNSGFKTGNIRDFLDNHGAGYDFFLPLDSDSVMSGDLIVRLVKSMETNPEIGILQTLAVGMPAESGFARMFQFGMRHGMRSFTMGAAWWNADCGPYWGHNALIRTGPFREHCELPVLPGAPPLGGHILSHDQLEAAFMRRGGYEVRVLPIETRSFEANPPTLPDFAQRDLRWCQGNMQYWRFLIEPGLLPLSRFQVLQAILMYVSPPAWVAMTFATVWKSVTAGFDTAYMELGFWLFITIFLLSVAPKVAGALDVVLTRGAIARYGGLGRFICSAFIELVCSMLMAPIIAIYVTVFLTGLFFGRSVTWSGQNRDKLGVSIRSATKAMALQTTIGLFLAASLFWGAGGIALAWSLPFVAGLCLAIPFTVITASAAYGRWASRLGLFAIPEESHMPRVLSGLISNNARRWRRPPGRGSADWTGEEAPAGWPVGWNER